MVKKSLMVFLLAASAGWLFPASGSPWGNLKKIYFYDSIHDEREVRKNLAEMDFTEATRREQKDLAGQLTRLGDRYFSLRKYDLAAEVYQKVLAVSPDSWTLYNRLERIKRGDGGMLLSIRTAWRQFAALRKSFKGSFLLVNSFVNVLFYSGLLVFFLFMIFILWKYFLLAVNDFAVSRVSPFSLKNLIWIGLLLVWPVAFLGGWGFYPFLIGGFLWVYMTGYEKNITKCLVFFLLVFSLLFAFNRYLEKSAASEPFLTVQRVFAGDPFDEKLSRRFDGGMKVLQAYFDYEHNRPEAALDILNSVPSDHRSTLKFDLLGNIHFEAGNFRQSIQAYRESLNLDRRNEITLRNFTVALLKYDDPKLLETYRSAYPGIDGAERSIQSLHVQRDFKINEKFLWKRLLNFSEPRFPLVRFLQMLLLGFIRVPVVLLAALMALYIAGLKKMYPFLGQSVYCSRCSKIIKKSYVDQSHILCDDCYQLFLIKDPIFYEAKIIKEKEINRKFRLTYIGFLVASIFVPGYYLNYREKSRTFVVFSWLFFLMFGFSLLASSLFRRYFGAAPLFLNYAGIAAFVLYFFVNLYSVKGDDNGI